jgi:hypothetical protein
MADLKKYHLPGKIFLVLAIFFVSRSNSYGQEAGSFLSDISGKPIPLHTEMNVTGSPFFPEEYTTATFYLPGGKKVENLKAKIFLPEHSVYYLMPEKGEMVAITAVEKIEFSLPAKTGGLITFRLYPSGPGTEKKYYQVLADGNIQLLKLYVSDFTDRKEFGSATITRTYDNLTSLYVYDDAHKLVKLTNSPEFFTGLFSAKQKQMSDFTQQQKINHKREQDLVKLFTYYNSL